MIFVCRLENVSITHLCPLMFGSHLKRSSKKLAHSFLNLLAAGTDDRSMHVRSEIDVDSSQ